METRIQGTVDGLVLPIPRIIAEQINLRLDSRVEVFAVDGRIVVRPLRRSKYTLEELLAKVTPENLHGEWDTGEPMGKEVW